MGEGLSLGLFILFFALAAPSRATGDQQQADDPSTPDLCVPHSPRVNCSYLPLEFLDCQELTDHQGNHSARDDEGYGCVKFGGQRFEDVEITKVYCTVLQGIECCGERQFLRDGFPCIKYSGHYFVTTLIYSVLLGFLGMDRFCLGHTGTAVGKLLTLGGVGIWWVVDIVLLITGSLTPEDGSNWNPYVMASITYSNAKRYRYFGQDEEAPEESPGESLRQRLLKALVQKQLSTHMSLDHQRRSQRTFVKAPCEESITGSTSGLASFESFRSVESLLHVRQTLKSCGLTDAEIRLLLDGESESSPLEAPHARRQRLEAIEEKLARHKKQLGGPLNTPEQTNGGPALGKAEHPPPRQDFLPPEHPMNHLRELAEELFPTQAPTPSHSPEPSRKRQQDKMAELTTPKRNRTEALQCIYLTEKPETYWDMQQIPKVLEPSTKRMSAPLPLPPEKTTTTTTTTTKDAPLLVTKKTEVKAADQTKPFILTLDPGDLIPLAVIEANKKSVQELKEMEKFKHYKEGPPSRTLYIKNLSARVSPKDLAALMGHFESSDGPKILYRILGGRMKGQAFVTFPDEEAASRALRACNGYVLHDRPMVAVYGKRA